MALPAARLARNAVYRRELAVQIFDIPTFLCPTLLRYNPYSYPFKQQQPSIYKAQRRCLHLAESKPAQVAPERLLPIQCTGCGAFAQTTSEGEPGFYTLGRKNVRAFLLGESLTDDGQNWRKQKNEVLLKALENADSELAASLNIDTTPGEATPTSKGPSS
jgi:hypothetical protein